MFVRKKKVSEEGIRLILNIFCLIDCRFYMYIYYRGKPPAISRNL